MKFITILIFFIVSTNAFTQNIYDGLKEKVEDKNGPFYYTTLIERLKNSDSTLTAEDFKAIYFGGIFLSSYMPEIISATESRIRDLNYAGKHLEAYELADSLLIEYPVSIQAYFEKTFACYNLKRFEEEEYNKKRYKILIRTVLKSGEGKTITSAWFANLPNDEFEVLKYLNLEIKEETEISAEENIYDHFFLKPNKSKTKEIFFNVTSQNR